MGRIDTENAKRLRKAMDVRIYIGNLLFTNDELMSCTVNLRGPTRALDTGSFSLEGSEIEFEARVEGDSDEWTRFVSEIDEDTEITYSAGYIGEEMSATRAFYLQDAEFDSSSSVLKINGCDATLSKLDFEYGGKYIASTYQSVRQDYYDGIKDILDESGIDYTESGYVPSGSGSTASNILFEKTTARELISRACGYFRNNSSLAITYRDAGIPQLIAGNATRQWTLSESDLSAFSSEIERNVKEYDIELVSYYVGSTEEVATASDCVAGQSYIVETSNPVYSVVASGTNCTAEKIGLYSVKINCTTSGECTVNGRFILQQLLSSDSPRHIVDSQQNGIIVTLEQMQLLNSNRGSLTAQAVRDMLDEQPVKYKFKWRGDPRMQPGDLLRINRYTAGYLRPSTSLYPANALYPTAGNVLNLSIESISLEHSEGGLTSEIEARVIVSYEDVGTLFPATNLYPRTNLYPE